ncbi:hypothetical protein CJ030_MR6G001570 [Morella rubra]|uniref:Uncharacterized protein n=1 Tax=Morella rubra TaxID=262757 RepID=A0A6A1V324_9ROSI|nr:hypothetical protein CJ030_MR7G001560 [Morella rubra]KAB1209710.1 hypothetical protein CJ030_MR6G001570 [Morella rubra]
MEEPSDGKIEGIQKVELQENQDVQSVAESSDGKSEETQKVESRTEDKDVVTKDVGDVEAVVDSVREIVVDGNSESLNGTYDAGDLDLKSSEVVDSGKAEEEKKVPDSLTDLEPVVSLSKDFSQAVEELIENSIGLESAEKEEKASLASTTTNGISPVVANDEVKGNGETTKFLSADENNGSEVVTNVVSRATEETTLLISKEDSGVPVVVSEAIEETKLQALDASVGEASKENVDNSSQPVASAPAADTSNAGEESYKTQIPESTGNPVGDSLRLDINAFYLGVSTHPATNFLEELLWAL